MYLAILSTEEKELFLGLAYNLASVDGNYSDEEKAMVAGYCQEMHLEFIKEKMVKPADILIERIKAISDKRTKKIILFEAVGLAMADGSYDSNERGLIEKMEKEFEIEPGFMHKCELLLNEYILFQDKIRQLVLE